MEQKINLVSTTDAANLWHRHILDSAQIYAVDLPDWKKWVDFGSGAGFPGIVAAILSPAAGSVTLVESDHRKSAFLRSAIIQLNLPARVVTERVEVVECLDADIVSARALAPLDTLLAYAHRHLKPKGLALFFKGAKATEELTIASRGWKMSCTRIQSKSDPSGEILKIGELSRV